MDSLYNTIPSISFLVATFLWDVSREKGPEMWCMFTKEWYNGVFEHETEYWKTVRTYDWFDF